MGLVLTGCPPKCEYVEYDWGTLSQEALAQVPYENGKAYSFRHSAGHEILFSCRRESNIEREFMDPCVSIVYEQNITSLIPDYPIFDMEFTIRKWDTVNYSVEAYIGHSPFVLQKNYGLGVEYSYFDSLSLDGSWYRYVYAIKRNPYSYSVPSGIYADSLWYNTSEGVIKVGMSNGEYYQKIPKND